MEPAPRRARVLDHGHVLALTLDGSRRLLVWTEDSELNDQFVTLDGRLWTWASLEECEAALRGLGCELDRDDDGTAVRELDLDPALAWLRGARAGVPVEAALNLWNLADDIAHSIGRPWSDRGMWPDRCHTKLTVANVPWAFGQSGYSPRWHPLELRALRRVLASALGLVRGALEPRQCVGT